MCEGGLVRSEEFAFGAQVFDVVAIELAGVADEGVSCVAFFEEKLGEVGAVLAGDA